MSGNCLPVRLEIDQAISWKRNMCVFAQYTNKQWLICTTQFAGCTNLLGNVHNSLLFRTFILTLREFQLEASERTKLLNDCFNNFILPENSLKTMILLHGYPNNGCLFYRKHFWSTLKNWPRRLGSLNYCIIVGDYQVADNKRWYWPTTSR